MHELSVEQEMPDTVSDVAMGGVIVHVEPFHVSLIPTSSPIAMQLVGLEQETEVKLGCGIGGPCGPPLRGGGFRTGGVEVTVQADPFHVSASGPFADLPTAMQNFAVGQETLDAEPSIVEEAKGSSDHSLPFQRSASGAYRFLVGP